MALTTAQFHLWKCLMYVLQLTIDLEFVCLLCPAYAEVFKYSGIYLAILEAAGQSNKNCGWSVLLDRKSVV